MKKIWEMANRLRNIFNRKTTLQLFFFFGSVANLFFAGFVIALVNTTNNFLQGSLIVLSGFSMGIIGLIMIIRREFPFSPVSDNIVGVISGIVLITIEILGMILGIIFFWS
jgi:hypothetical protein